MFIELFQFHWPLFADDCDMLSANKDEFKTLVTVNISWTQFLCFADFAPTHQLCRETSTHHIGFTITAAMQEFHECHICHSPRQRLSRYLFVIAQTLTTRFVQKTMHIIQKYCKNVPKFKKWTKKEMIMKITKIKCTSKYLSFFPVCHLYIDIMSIIYFVCLNFLLRYHLHYCVFLNFSSKHTGLCLIFVVLIL